MREITRDTTVGRRLGLKRAKVKVTKVALVQGLQKGDRTMWLRASSPSSSSLSDTSSPRAVLQRTQRPEENPVRMAMRRSFFFSFLFFSFLFYSFPFF